MKRSAAIRRSEARQLDAYRAWAAPLAFCLATGRPDAQMAHIRCFTGAGIKPPPQHVLPLCQEAHSIQETRRTFWPEIGVAEPTREAEELFRIWEARDAAWWQARLTALHEQIDREAVARLLRRVA